MKKKMKINLLTVFMFCMTMVIPASSLASSKPLTLIDMYGINKEGSLGSWYYEIIDLDDSSREIYIANGETELNFTIHYIDDKLIQITSSSGKSKIVNGENPLEVISAVNKITPTGNTTVCIIWWVIALAVVPWMIGLIMIALSYLVC